MMTRRWFLKLVSALSPLFGVKAEVEAECPFKGEINIKPEDLRMSTPAEPEVNELLARCRVPGTLMAAVLNAGCIWQSVSRKSEVTGDTLEEFFPVDKEGTSWRAVGTPLPKLDTAEKVEIASLGIGDPVRYAGVDLFGVFNHPNATVMKQATQDYDSVFAQTVAMMSELSSKKFYGPYVLVHSGRWPQDLKNAIMNLESITEVITDTKHSIGARFALIQLTPDVIQMIVCRDRIVPRIRSDMFGNCGIVIGEQL